MKALDNIAIRVTGLTGRIVLARFGKDPSLALDQRDAGSEFWQALVAYAFNGKMPAPGQGAEIKFGSGDEQFTLTVRREIEEAAVQLKRTANAARSMEARQ